jgi:hypothetical protein
MASVAAVAGGPVVKEYGEMKNPELIRAIELALRTLVISPQTLLRRCMQVSIMSVAGSPALNPLDNVRTVVLSSSIGNHGVLVGKGTSINDPIGRITIQLEGETLAKVPGVTTRRHDQAVGVAQPVFHPLIDKLNELFLKVHQPDGGVRAPATVPSPAFFQGGVGERQNWENIADNLMEALNEGIRLGRENFEHKLTVLFDRIRGLETGDVNKLRAKYCKWALDVLRNDGIDDFGSTIQKGVLATINTHNEEEDKYPIHNGKKVQPGNPIARAAFNLLFVVNFVIGERVYTVRLELNRPEVKRLVEEFNVERARVADDGIGPRVSASYFAGDLIKWIHENKREFFSIVKDLLGAYVSTNSHIPYLMAKMESMLAPPVKEGDAVAADPPLPHLYHAATVLCCKCPTLFLPAGSGFLVRNESGSTFSQLAVTTLNNDVIAGELPVQQSGRTHFVSINPIEVKRNDNNVVSKITVVNFDPGRFSHAPTYPDGEPALTRVLALPEGKTLDTIGLSYSRDSGSLVLQGAVVQQADDVVAEEADYQARVKAAEAAKAAKAKEEAEAAKALIKKIKEDISAPVAADPVAAAASSAAAAETLLGQTMTFGKDVITRALGAICDTFQSYLFSPFTTSLPRTGVEAAAEAPETGLLHEGTSLSITVVLMCALIGIEKKAEAKAAKAALEALEAEAAVLKAEEEARGAGNDDSDLQARIAEATRLIEIAELRIKRCDTELRQNVEAVSAVFNSNPASEFTKLAQQLTLLNSANPADSANSAKRFKLHAGMKRRTLRRGVKKNSIRSRRSRRYNRNRSKKKNTQRRHHRSRCSRKSKPSR